MSREEWGDLQVIRLADNEARGLGHHWVGCEHFLLGLLANRGAAVAEVLARRDVTLDDVRQRIGRIVDAHETPDRSEEGRRRWTPRAFYVERLMDVECERLGSHEPSEGHLFLALLTEGRSIAMRILTELGVDLRRARGEVLEDLQVPVQTRERYIRERDEYDLRRPDGR